MEKDKKNTNSLLNMLMRTRPKEKSYKNTYAIENVKQNAISNSSKDLSSQFTLEHNGENTDWIASSKIKTADNCNFKYHRTKFKPNYFLSNEQTKNSNFYPQLFELSKKHPNDILLTILDERSGFLHIIEENNLKEDDIARLLISLGKACTSDLSANVHNLVKTVSWNSKFFLLHMQRLLVFIQKQKVLDKVHIDSIFFSTVLLEKFQSILPSTSSELISILFPLLDSTCTKCLKTGEDMHNTISQKIKEIDEKNQYFLKNFTSVELKRESKKEKLQLQEPPENFRCIPVIPTVDDIKLPCSFLRPNIAQGKYKDVEHYLDVQYRLLREDFIQPLREGIIEYLNQKKVGKYIKNFKNIKVYYNVSVGDEEFVNGQLLHLVQFSDKQFSNIKWESNKRFLTGSLLCFSLDNFETMLFASIVHRDPKQLVKGLLLVRFEEITEVLKMYKLTDFVVIETSAYFEAYRHNLNALKQLDADTLPLKKYIIDVEKNVSNCKYLCPTVIFDMRPLLIPLDKKYIKGTCDIQYQYPENISSNAEFVTVMDEHSWPKATELNLDDSQYLALKSAITKEFSIIQGPPGTGKTYIGLRVVQLLLHNLSKWFIDKIRSLPILVICYTNHALDQFLEGILLFTNKICRVGGRGTNKEISEFNLSNLRKNCFYPDILPKGVLNCFHLKQNVIKALKGEINLIKTWLEISTKTVLNEVQLKKYIPLIHYNSLIKYNHGNIGTTIYNWLVISESAAMAAGESGDNKLKNQDCFSSSFVGNEKLDSEDEADIEYIESQRNIDFDDYGAFFNADSESVENGKENTCKWKTVQRNKQHFKMIEYITQCLEYYQPMKEDIALQVECVWSLDLENRWQLYKYWLQKFTEENQNDFFYLQEELKTTLQELNEIRMEEDTYVLRNTQVVGVTTTGAAKYRDLIQRLKPMIVIAEEAAEVLESHIITSLAPTTQHVILIGDHQQLRPSPAVHMLAVKYDMNISLFERMVKNKVDYCRLSIQHRMRPAIAALIVPHIYSSLENHRDVTEFENIKGVHKNVFFVSHNFNELPENESKSRVNEHEARFIIQLCRYLILQGYDSSQITVLTTYTGQLLVLKQFVTDEINKVRFTVVDNYQGEENDIILISFVRSNDEGVIGFLKVPNRVCVALSRAKKGLFCIGNFELLAEKSNLWKNIVETLNSTQSIGSSLQLTCQNHPNTHNYVTKGTDFKNVLDGGCNQKCEYRLLCGHTCNLMCHPYSHELILCEKPCAQICEKGHLCEEGHPCYQECHCKVLVEKTLQQCGHTVKEPCSKPEEEIVCKNPCKKNCEKGHDCQKMCYEFCGSCSNEVDKTLKCGFSKCMFVSDFEEDTFCGKTCESENRHTCLKTFLEFCGSCEVLVDKTLDSCGHTIKVACGKKIIHCNEPCIKTCKKGHQCPKKCFEVCGLCEVLEDKILKRCKHTVKAPCYKIESQVLCPFQCEKILPCSHQCSNKCGDCCIIRCKKPCLKTCEKGHPCHKICFEKCTCTFNVDKTLKRCGHTVKAPCEVAEDKIKCSAKCKKELDCSHNCTNKCSEPCLETCMEFVEAQSPICGHFVEVNCYIANSSVHLLKKCSEELFKICSKLCHFVLPCGHKCKGTCGQCYQGRLHIPCKEACEQILICGHKCMSICSKSCPPCQHSCENKCMHSKCNKKCSEPCTRCTKTCEWSCIHKKCTRPCNEICNCEPCNQPCPKILKCDHPCIGFCGEPCPEECRTCDSKEECIVTKPEDNTTYVLLEECKHVFEVKFLNRWMMDNSGGDKEVVMKTCPTCKTVIRKNLRYNNIVKNCLLKLEKVKQMTMTKWNGKENAKLQSALLQKSVIITFLSNFKPSRNSLFQYLSSNTTRSIQELIAIENIISIATGLKQFNEKYSETKSQITRSLIEYTHITCMWLSNFILKCFLTVSEYQLIQVMYEVHRLILINQLLKYAEPQYLELYCLDFENCSRYLLNYTSFDEASENNFTVSFQALYSKLGDSSEVKASIIEFPLLKAMDLSTGHWHECPEGHIYCIVKYVGSIKEGCYKCMNNCKDESNPIEKPLQEATRRPPPLYVWTETESWGRGQTSHGSSHIRGETKTRGKTSQYGHRLPAKESLIATEIQTSQKKYHDLPTTSRLTGMRMQLGQTFNSGLKASFVRTMPQAQRSYSKMAEIHATPRWPARHLMRPGTQFAASFQAMRSTAFARVTGQPAVTAFQNLGMNAYHITGHQPTANATEVDVGTRVAEGPTGVESARSATRAAANINQALPVNKYISPNMCNPPQPQTVRQATGIQGQETCTASMLTNANPQEQKEMLGENLFPVIYRLYPDLAGKITGMLLEIDNSELLHMLEHHESLKAKIEEAVTILQVHYAKQNLAVLGGIIKKEG